MVAIHQIILQIKCALDLMVTSTFTNQKTDWAKHIFFSHIPNKDQKMTTFLWTKLSCKNILLWKRSRWYYNQLILRVTKNIRSFQCIRFFASKRTIFLSTFQLGNVFHDLCTFKNKIEIKNGFPFTWMYFGGILLRGECSSREKEA